MAITTYAELKTALADWSARSDLTSFLDDFIDQTESFFSYPPLPPTKPGIGGIRANITRGTGTFSTSVSTIARPADFLEAYRLKTTDAAGCVLDYVSAEELAIKFRSETGRPRYWTVSDVIELDVVSDSDYPYELSYYPTFAALSVSNTENWVLTNYPNVYLSGCLYNLYLFNLDMQRANHWLTQYKSGAHAINAAYERSRRSQGPIAMKVA